MTRSPSRPASRPRPDRQASPVSGGRRADRPPAQAGSPAQPSRAPTTRASPGDRSATAASATRSARASSPGSAPLRYAPTPETLIGPSFPIGPGRDGPADPRLDTLLRRWLSLVHERSTGDALAQMAELGLTLPQLFTLHLLHQHGPHAIGAIARRLGLAAASTTHLVDGLVARALVERHEDVRDRRARRVELTYAGRGIVDRLSEARSRELAAVLDRLPAPLHRELVDVLGRAAAALADAPAPARTSERIPR